jgi:hypothetical protein
MEVKSNKQSILKKRMLRKRWKMRRKKIKKSIMIRCHLIVLLQIDLKMHLRSLNLPLQKTS